MWDVPDRGIKKDPEDEEEEEQHREMMRIRNRRKRRSSGATSVTSCTTNTASTYSRDANIRGTEPEPTHLSASPQRLPQPDKLLPSYSTTTSNAYPTPTPTQSNTQSESTQPHTQPISQSQTQSQSQPQSYPPLSSVPIPSRQIVEYSYPPASTISSLPSPPLSQVSSPPPPPPLLSEPDYFSPPPAQQQAGIAWQQRQQKRQQNVRNRRPTAETIPRQRFPGLQSDVHDNDLFDSVLAGIGRMHVSMVTDSAGRWRIDRTGEDEDDFAFS